MAEQDPLKQHETHVEGAERERKAREVLICMDGSEHSEQAFEWYAANVHKAENDVIVFNAAETPNMTAYVGFGAAFAFPAEEWKRISDEHIAQVKELQKKCEQRMRSHHMHGKVVVFRVDAPGPAICEYSKENNIDVIVMGCRGMGAIRRTLMGSISDYVLHHAHVPVLVVPPADRHAHHK